MSEMTLIVPNDWVTEEKLVEITGLRPALSSGHAKTVGWSDGNICMFPGRRAEKKQ